MGQSFVESPRDEPRRRTGAIWWVPWEHSWQLPRCWPPLAIWRCSIYCAESAKVTTWCNTQQYQFIFIIIYIIYHTLNVTQNMVSDFSHLTYLTYYWLFSPPKICIWGLWTSSSPRTWTRTLGCWRMWRRSKWLLCEYVKNSTRTKKGGS